LIIIKKKKKKKQDAAGTCMLPKFNKEDAANI